MGRAGNDRPVRLLHLSDMHFRTSKSWDADPVLRALTDFVGKTVEAEGPPDLVAITGDLAFSGKADEYRLARAWLDQLWTELGSPPKDRLLMVPGNHDVDRDKVDFIAEATQERLLKKGLEASKSQQQIATVLGTDGQRDILLNRHSDYLAFAAEWYGGAQPLPWWHRVIDINGLTLHVAGLDSAWMACGDEDSTRLLLGRYQLTQTVETAKANAADWRLALVHHPWDDLAEFDRHAARDTVHRHCDVLLRGHLHHPHPEHIRQPERHCLELPTGCVYEASQYPNAFQWIELSPPPAKRVQVRFCVWHEGAWKLDKLRGTDGWWNVDLAAQQPAEPAGIVRRAAPLEVPAAYLDWLRRNLQQVELLGAKEGRSVILSSVYVPALTQASPAQEADAESARQRRDQPVEQRPIPLLQRLDAESLYVPAPAGTGKSTFCCWAVLQSIAGGEIAHPVPAPEEFTEPVPANLRGRLPVLICLRDFHLDMDCGRGRRFWHRGQLEQAMAAWAAGSSPEGLTGALLLAHLRAGSALLLLDGLDEVPVSDTRDGATVYPRDLLLSGLAEALPTWLKAGNRVLLTSRPYGLDEAGLHRLGLSSAPLEPLPVPLQDLFVARWFHALDKAEQTADLVATIRGRDDLTPLVENPMLLTALCVLYDSGGRLPEDRCALYKRIVDNVLFHRFRDEAREREPARARLEAIALGMHGGDAESPRLSPEAEISHLDIDRLLREFAAEDSSYERGRVEPVAQREALLTRSGLLLPRPNDRAAFYHLSIQEFLAAERILRTKDDLLPVFRERGAVAEWRPTLLFLFAGKIAAKTPRWGADLLLRLIADQNRAAVKANAAPAVFVAEALELCLAKNYAVPEELKDRFRRLALDAIEDEVQLRSRQALGLSLGRLGDPRIRSLRDPAAYVEVPAGRYPYGDEKKAVVEIATPFRIGRYPVTNGQYREFIEDGGYRDRGHQWWSEDGRAWLQHAQVTEPRYWHHGRWNSANQPVVGVNFWEAEACSAWARGRLPTEQEWEAVARGPQGLEYPWGGERQDEICNTREAGLGVTSLVGLFPRSRQAELGIEDLAGNVWEWCASLYGAADKNFPDARVLRGGSWDDDLDYARSASRYRYHPYYRISFFGFRAVRVLPVWNTDC